MKTWPLTVLIGLAVAFGGWNALETHLMRSELSGLKQFVLDSKEARIAYQGMNDAQHSEYELEMKRITLETARLYKEIAELRFRIAVMEKK